MFTTITNYHNIQALHREYIWEIGENSSTGWLAGALLGSEIIRVRCIHSPHLDKTRYHLAIQTANAATASSFAQAVCNEDLAIQTDNAANTTGTLPYHSWIVNRGDEQWPIIGEQDSTQAILAPYLQGFAFSDTEIRLTRPLASEERIYGLGERTGPMNKRGQTFPIWNVDPPLRHNAETSTMYTSIPFYIGLQLETGRAYGMLIDHTGLITMDIGHSEASEVNITLEGDSMVAYFFVGPTPADVLRQYADLTGSMPLPSRWAIGHHQCRWSYMSEQQVLELAATLRQRQHPCDAIWLDIDYMQGYRDFTWNSATFPDPARMTQQLHEQGFHLVTIIDPGIKVDEEYSIYQQGMQNDYFCRYEQGDLFLGSVWPGTCVFPDFSRSQVRQWWGELYQQLLAQGVDAFWNDMNEPALTNFFSSTQQDQLAVEEKEEQEQDESLLHGKTMDNTVLHRAGGDQPSGPDGPPVLHKFFHNAYGMEMARATYEGLNRLRPNSRPFVLTRSGTAGVQRYAAVWTGDNSSIWEHIPLAISMCLNLGMSGVPLVGADIGGFWGDSTGELLARFAQLGALMPFSRNHNAMGNVDQEPWAFEEPYESAYRKAIATRYQLMPYLYTLFYQAATRGEPVMRPLYYHYPQDQQACDVEDAFLIGDALLSAPVFEQGATSREVYLPASTWFDYWDGTAYPGGGTSEIPAPLDRWPLLVRGNSILPSSSVMQYADERAADPMTFTCYMATDGLASYTLYEDDGNTQDYKNGAFALTEISCRVAGDTVTVSIDEQHNGYHPSRQEYEIIVYIGGRRLQQRVKVGQGNSILTL
ncbi:MAG TPA: TIM-barrel domain-containing protein [Ktedonobacteraceae bacterium]|nr:TIM-barrel domain-containing protein [Ktedonobacteraceae bacterium]